MNTPPTDNALLDAQLGNDTYAPPDQVQYTVVNRCFVGTSRIIYYSPPKGLCVGFNGLGKGLRLVNRSFTRSVILDDRHIEELLAGYHSNTPITQKSFSASATPAGPTNSSKLRPVKPCLSPKHFTDTALPETKSVAEVVSASEPSSVAGLLDAVSASLAAYLGEQAVEPDYTTTQLAPVRPRTVTNEPEEGALVGDYFSVSRINGLRTRRQRMWSAYSEPSSPAELVDAKEEAQLEAERFNGGWNHRPLSLSYFADRLVKTTLSMDNILSDIDANMRGCSEAHKAQVSEDSRVAALFATLKQQTTANPLPSEPVPSEPKQATHPSQHANKQPCREQPSMPGSRSYSRPNRRGNNRHRHNNN
ncbi:hypothetical protein GGI16_001033 [Coemansia sp. S142-1]|nr:hypothetical protein GGI16_001033 [Coemansia sp. S142-1]